jgi:hypothetical protein
MAGDVETKHQREQREARERKQERRERIRQDKAQQERRALCQIGCEISWEEFAKLLIAAGLVPEDTEQILQIDRVEGGIVVVGLRHYMPTLQ